MTQISEVALCSERRLLKAKLSIKKKRSLATKERILIRNIVPHIWHGILDNLLAVEEET